MTGLLGGRHISASTYLRLFVDQLLPTEADRVLYLDADMLVRTDLTPLYQADLQGKTIGAVRDLVIADLSHPYSGITDYMQRGLPSDGHYFNAGLLLIDLNRWRSERLGHAILEYARQHGGQGNFDQDALNASVHRDWTELDLTWNVQGSVLLLDEHPSHPWVEEMRALRADLLRDPATVHFSGTIKPWHASSGHPFACEWRRELRRSSWYSAMEHARWAGPFGTKRLAVQVLVKSHRRAVREISA